MKKIKKWIVAMLAVLLIPVALSGCSFGKTTLAKSKDQVWYYFDENGKELEAVEILNGDKLTEYTVVGEIPTKKLIGKNEDEIKKVVKKYGEPIRTYDVSGFDILQDNDKKTVQELIVNGDSEDSDNYKYLFSLTDAGTTIKVDGKTLTGFKINDDPEGKLAHEGYLVTNSSKVEFDSSKTDKVNTYSVSDLRNLGEN